MEEQVDSLPEAGGQPQRRLNWVGIIGSLVIPAAVLALIVGGLWYWQGRGSGSSNSPYGTVALPTGKNPTGQGPSPRTGRAGPDFLLEKSGGGTLRLSDLQGHPVLLNFWASWCAPCRSEVPELVAAYAKYQAQGLIIVGVDLQEADSNVQSFAQEFGITYPLVIDRDGEVGNVWRIGGPFSGLPSSYFIDSSGVVQDSYPGQLTQDLLNKKLAKILPGGAG
jgi:peroxiredoxin